MIKIVTKSISLLIITLILLTLGSTVTFAENSASPWNFSMLPRFWGTDMCWEYHGLTMREGLDTSLIFALSGAIEDSGYYRNPDNSLYTPQSDSEHSNSGVLRRQSLLVDLGIKQGILYNPDQKRNLLEAFLLYHGRFFQNKQADSPDNALFFQSGLPETDELTEHTFSTGISYNTVQTDPETQLRTGENLTLMYEIAPGSLNDISDYSRFNATYIEFIPLVKTDVVNLYLGARLLYDQLNGDYIPAHARTSIGGVLFNSPGLGGSVRGIHSGRFDGTKKMIINTEIRANFPTAINADYIPGLIVFADCGVYDDLTGDIDWNNSLASIGIGPTLHFIWPFLNGDLIITENYFFDDHNSSIRFTVANHF